MKRIRQTLGLALMGITMVLTPVFFTSCEDELTSRCRCDTQAIGEKMTLDAIYLKVYNYKAEDPSTLAYYNGEYYFTTEKNGITTYYFICNPELITGFADTVQYNIMGQAHQSSDIMFDLMYSEGSVYNEFEVTSAEIVPQEQEE